KETSFFSFFSSSGPDHRAKTASTALKEPVLKKTPPSIPQANLVTVENWVAMEEKIVHDYTERKAVLPSKPVSPATSAKGLGLFRFLTSLRSALSKQNKTVPVKESFRKPSPLRMPRMPQIDLSKIKKWSGAEEKTVGKLIEKKITPAALATSSTKTPERPAPAAFEAFNTRTTVSLNTVKPSSKVEPKGSFKISWTALLLPGWVLAGVLVFLVTQEFFKNQEMSSQLAQVTSTKNWLERSYADLKQSSVEKSAEIQWLNSQIREMTEELSAVKGQRDAYKADIARLTARYESELNRLRDDLSTKDAVVSGLKAQIRAFEGILDKGGIAAVPGAVSQVFSSQAEGPSSMARSRVVEINVRQGFLVIDAGYEQGIDYGASVVISRGGRGLTMGRVDRVYPTMSTVIVPDKKILNNIFEGDSVSFT
ncbi:MAG TPA: hypothetical protein P5561_05200, partial [Candidatus Omnitrophota bacterium]|nr:hypothetical protein [Candidatus Omnitrophota bacterium]